MNNKFKKAFNVSYSNEILDAKQVKIINSNNTYFNRVLGSISKICHDEYSFVVLDIFIESFTVRSGINREELISYSNSGIPRSFIESTLYNKCTAYTLFDYDFEKVEKYFKHSLLQIEADNLVVINHYYKSKTNSQAFVKLNTHNFSKIVMENNFYMSKHEWKEVTIDNCEFLHSGNFSSLQKIAINKSKTINIAKHSLKTCKKLSQMKLQIDKEASIIAKEEVNTEIQKLKKEIGWNFYLSYKANIDELKNSIKNSDSLKNKNSLKISNLMKTLKKEKIDNISEKIDNISEKIDNISEKIDNISEKIDNIKHASRKPINEISVKSSFLSKLLFYEKTLQILDMDYYYIPHSYDFRGRNYSNSMGGPVFNKIVRPVIIIEKNNKKNIENSIYYKKICGLTGANSVLEYYKYIILIDIGKCFSNEIIRNSDENRVYITINEFISMGYKVYNKKCYIKDLDVDERIYIRILIQKLETLMSNKEITWAPGLYDSTASGQQVLSKYRNIKTNLKTLNLTGDVWYDTYLVTLKDIKEHLNREFRDSENILKMIEEIDRKVIKLPIMTSFYNVTPYKTHINIKSRLSKKNSYNYNNKDVAKISWAIHNYLSNNYVVKLLQIDNLEKLQINNNISKEVCLLYYNLKTREERIRIKGISKSHSYTRRVKIKYRYLLNSQLDIEALKNEKILNFQDNKNTVFEKIDTELYKKKSIIRTEVDIKKSIRAKPANIAHYLDSKIIEEICKTLKGYPIHDMVITNLLDKHELIDKLNNIYDNDYDTFSLFIMK